MKESDKINLYKYSTWYINVLTLIISILIFLAINIFGTQFTFQSQNSILKAGFSVSSEINPEINLIQKANNWYLEIPSIQLKANIEEGTSKEIMNQFVGHFEESKKWIGNVCLAAHNRGYENNYFAEIKQLKEGDEIIYHYEENTRKYVVEKNFIIQDTDLFYLENTQENRITLITCVENEPNYRRCVQAIEKEK